VQEWHGTGDFVRNGQTGNNVARGAPREQTPGKRRQVDLEGSTGIKDPGTRRQLCLRNEKTDSQIFGKTFRLENAKLIARSTVWLRTNENWTLEGSTPSEREKEAAHRAGASHVETPATQDCLNPLSEGKSFG
jgi:hypothetical protein